ncbi:AAA family ATPase [Thermoflavimicrobium daqui]|uniref:AAA family ATPase n=1 Tax=Thermoflavimicrobium daqui TaxID=2137476 RepID=UPI00143DE782|nr:AAA family ATPase [Thermoflavimicrobium daqui]
MQTPFLSQIENFQMVTDEFFVKSRTYREKSGQLEQALILGDRLLVAGKGISPWGLIDRFSERLHTYSTSNPKSLLELIDEWFKVVYHYVFPKQPLYPEMNLWEIMNVLQVHSDDLEDEINRLFDLAYQMRNSLIYSDQPLSDIKEDQLIKATMAVIIAPLYRHFEAIQLRLRNLVVHSIENEETISLLQSTESVRLQKVKAFLTREELVLQMTKKLQLNDGNREQGKYYLLTGFEGSGKSTLVSQMIENLVNTTPVYGFYADHVQRTAPWLPFTLFVDGKQSNRIGTLMNSVMEQANTLMVNPIHQQILPKEPLSKRMEQYRRLITQLLEQMVKERGQALLIIDHFDEIGKYDNQLFSFLPTSLPLGAKVLLTTQSNSFAERWVHHHIKANSLEIWRIGHFTEQEALDVLSVNEDKVGAREVSKWWHKNAGWPVYVQYVSQQLQEGKELQDIQPFQAHIFFEEWIQEWNHSSDTKEQAALDKVLKLLAIFEPVGPLHLDLVHYFLYQNGIQIDKPTLKKRLAKFNGQLEGLNSQMLRLSLSSYAEYIRETYYNQFDLIPFFKKIIHWLLQLKEYFDTKVVLDVLSRFTFHWANQQNIRQKKFAEITIKLVDQLNQEKEADLLYGMFQQIQKDKGMTLLASHCLRKSADLGHAPAMLAMGMERLGGKRSKEKFAEGIMWLERAANQGNTEAMLVLSNYLLDGKGMERDIDKGREWLEKAVECGYDEAVLTLANRLLDRKGLPRNESRGKYLLEKLAYSGHTGAMVKLARRLLDRRGLKRDVIEGEKWLKEAARRDHVAAMLELGRRFMQGKGLPKDEELGRKWLEKAIKCGHVGAMYTLGSCLLAKGKEEGRSWLEKAAVRGHTGAMLELGRRFLDGKGISRQEIVGRKWLEEAAHNGNSGAMLELGRRLLDGRGLEAEQENGKKWLEKAAKDGNTGAKLELSRRLLDGKGLEVNKWEGKAWLEQLASQGNEGAMLELGIRYIEGIALEKDKVAGRNWLEEAAINGNVEAMFILGNRLLDGTGLDTDKETGEKWLKRAAEYGNVKAMITLADRLLEGHGLEKCEVKGKNWLEEAAISGNVGAMLELGKRLCTGTGLEQNQLEGEKWIKEAK